MVTHHDFVRFAADLVQSEDEVARRTAISRAYYGVFHHLRRVAEERVGLPHFGTAEDHRDVEAALRQFNREAAGEFAYLRRMRIRADYDTTGIVTRELARVCHARAMELLYVE